MTGSQAGHNESQKWISPRAFCILCFVARKEPFGFPSEPLWAAPASLKACSYTFARRAVIATLDLSASNIRALKADHWLRDWKNVILLELAEEAFIRMPPVGSHLPRPGSPTHPTMMRPHMSAPYPAVCSLPFQIMNLGRKPGYGAHCTVGTVTSFLPKCDFEIICFGRSSADFCC